MLIKLIRENYSFELEDLAFIDSHFGTEIYIVQTNQGKYIVKSLPPKFGNLENEGYITDFLSEQGIDVAKIQTTRMGKYSVKTDNMQFHVQEFIEGINYKVNTAPYWFMVKSAKALGKIHHVLKDYKELSRSFGDEFFDKSNIKNKRDYLLNLLNSEDAKNDEKITFEIQEQIKHAGKILSFNFDTKRLTYSNSHGDYYIGQVITNDNKFTVIDWTSACSLPLCIEVIMSYTFADPACINGKIDLNRFKKYIRNYSEYFTLSDYDITIMPYLFYYHQFMTNYTPPFDDVPEGYRAVSLLINNLLNWLFENVEQLSMELSVL